MSAKRITNLCLVLLLAMFVVSCGNDDNPSTTIQQPSVTGMTPAQVFLGEQNVDGRILGSNLSGAVSVNLGDGITVASVQSMSANEIQVIFHVSRTAPAGARTISVTTAAGTASVAGMFQVGNNAVPVANFKITAASRSKNADITFDASASSDDNKVASYHFDFGDGQTASGKVVIHKYTKAGSYTVVLTVADNQGGKTKLSKALEIEDNFAPEAVFTGPTEAETHASVTFDGSASKDKDGRVVKWLWRLGDGTTVEGKKVTHKYTSEKTFAVELVVTDNDNASSKVVKEIKVKERSGGGGGGGGTSGTCDVNNFRSNTFRVISVSGNTMTVDRNFRSCPACGEIRRRGVEGVREFVGDVTRIDGNRITLDYGRLPASTRPNPGENMVLVWKPRNERPRCTS